MTEADSQGGPADRWSPPDLPDRVACVAGASYGVGRGVSEVLGECGATVYVTGRSTRQGPTKAAHWTVEDTAELVTDRGGLGVPVAVDHTADPEVEALFAQARSDHGRLDLLVHNVWQWGRLETYTVPSWEQPVERWDAMVGVGLRSLFLAVRHALALMSPQGGPVIATQERPGDADRFGDNIVVDAAAVATGRMIEFLGHELADTPMTALLVYLGWVRTVNRGMGFDPAEYGMTEDEFVAMTQSPHLVGRAIAMLAADPTVHDRSGQTLYAGDLALAYGFTDLDGRDLSDWATGSR